MPDFPQGRYKRPDAAFETGARYSGLQAYEVYLRQHCAGTLRVPAHS